MIQITGALQKFAIGVTNQSKGQCQALLLIVAVEVCRGNSSFVFQSPIRYQSYVQHIEIIDCSSTSTLEEMVRVETTAQTSLQIHQTRDGHFFCSD